MTSRYGITICDSTKYFMEIEIIKEKIHVIRGQKVMLDFDLAAMFEIDTKVLKQALRRNLN